MRTFDSNDVIFRTDEIVFHPDVPSEVVTCLRAADPKWLVPFRGVPIPKGLRDAVRSFWLRAWLWGGVAAGLSTAAVFAAIAAHHYDSGNPDNAGYGGPDGVANLAVFGAIAAWITFVVVIRTVGHRRREERMTADACDYHRRYVVPQTDLDRKAMKLWSRVISATSRIVNSDVVQQQRIDTVRVSTVLPYHLWDLAEKLAWLSALRVESQEILARVDADDPDVAVVLGPQRHASTLADADIERQVRQLEVFADRTEEADAALRREQAVRRLATLNDPYTDLLARVAPSGENKEIARLSSHDVQAVIDQANEAVSQANEAGRHLGLPESGG